MMASCLFIFVAFSLALGWRCEAEAKVRDALAHQSVFTLDRKYLATGAPYNVSYDSRAVLLNGERTMLISGSIHYARSTQEMWPSILSQTKAAGVNLIETYVFWNLHEPSPGVYNWSGYADLVTFLKLCQEYELYVNLRIGPYACAEWNYGGFPIWLKFLDGVVFRDYNAPFMIAMQNWMTYLVTYLQPMFAGQGGPIILAQVENEYGWLEQAYGADGRRYAVWAASMANSLSIGVPWTMCAQDDIATVIDTCNGFYCDSWIAGHQGTFPDQPSLFTENWTGWFQDWSQAKPTRPVADLAFSVARFIARGGTHNNYYMWHGGTNFGRWSGGPFIVSSYDYDAPLDEYGLPNQPKYNHLAALHALLLEHADAILAAAPVQFEYSSTLSSSSFGSGSDTFAFLSNIDPSATGTVKYNGSVYQLPPWSVSLVYQGAVLFNTATVETPKIERTMTPLPVLSLGDSSGNWTWWAEPAGVWGSNAVFSPTPLEQLNLTQDTSDYLWYTHNVTTTSSSAPATLTLNNTGDLLYLFINGTLYGLRRGEAGPVSFSFSALPAGTHQLQILSLTVGLLNYGEHMEQWSRGLQGAVTWNGVDITGAGWLHQPGLLGEKLQIYGVSWNQSSAPTNRSLTWYKATFDLPSFVGPNASLALDLGGMGKGFIYLNGYAVGRYWNVIGQGNCSGCSYAGSFSPSGGCQVGCGQASQTYYHVPRSWFHDTDNGMVLFEEMGGDVTTVALTQRE